MTFVHPIEALIAAGIVIPLLILLYVLKLRRQSQRIPSTLLWQRAVDDLEVNAPFQRLRSSPLLWIQLLLLIILLLALAQPRIEQEASPASRIVLLIDRSASMQAIVDEENARTRLDVARDAAAEIIRQLNRGETSQRMMIIAFDAVPEVISTYQPDRRLLLDALPGIKASNAEANLDAALQLASAFATPSEDPGDQPPEVILISDGNLASPESGRGHVLRHGRFRYVQVAGGDQSENLGIVSLSARRDRDDPTTVAVVARLINTSPATIETTLLLEVEGQQPITIPARVPAATAEGPGEQAVSRAVDIPEGGILALRHTRNDSFPLDDTAAVVMPRPSKPHVLLVHDGEAPDPDLLDMLRAIQTEDLRIRTTGAYRALDPGEVDAGEIADLIVFDRVQQARLPGVPSLSFGSTPVGLDTTEPTVLGGQPVLSWDRQHPLLRHVSLDTVLFTGFGAFIPPETAEVLARGPGGPVIVTMATRGARHVVVGFELGRSTWPLNVGFAVFCGNAVEFLTLAESGQQTRAVRPGDVVTVRPRRDVNEVVIDGPGRAMVPVTEDGPVALPRFEQLGVYEITGVAEVDRRIAVSLLSPVESDIRPRESVRVNARNAGAASAQALSPKELWPWLAAAAMLLLAIEWLIYCRRMRT